MFPNIFLSNIFFKCIIIIKITISAKHKPQRLKASKSKFVSLSLSPLQSLLFFLTPFRDLPLHHGIVKVNTRFASSSSSGTRSARSHESQNVKVKPQTQTQTQQRIASSSCLSVSLFSSPSLPSVICHFIPGPLELNPTRIVKVNCIEKITLLEIDIKEL
jgi:hypothetical protein